MPEKGDEPSTIREFTTAEMGAIAHLYRGEVYRSTVWRTRLDTSTNWSVVTLGVAMSVSFSSPDASPIPLLLAGLLILFLLVLEARRYRYFNVWRARARWMETHFYARLVGGDVATTFGFYLSCPWPTSARSRCTRHRCNIWPNSWIVQHLALCMDLLCWPLGSAATAA